MLRFMVELIEWKAILLSVQSNVCYCIVFLSRSQATTRHTHTMLLATTVLFALLANGLCEKGVALMQYNSSEQSSLESVNRVSHGAVDTKSRQFHQGEISNEASTEHNARVDTTVRPILPRIFVLVVDYFVNVTSFNHDRSNDVIDSPESSTLAKLPQLANLPRSGLPSNSSVLSPSSGVQKAQGAKPKTASNLQSKEDEQKRSDTSLLFLVEVRCSYLRTCSFK